MNAAEEASKDRATASLFPEIGELVPIGDGRSAALVGPDGAVEFFCPLRFDAPALVFPILDRLRGGRLRVGPVESPGTRLSCRRHYRQASSVLTLEWFGASGSARMHMAMKWLPQEQEQEQEQEILWLLEGLDGSMEAEVVLAPSPGFGVDTIDLDVSEAPWV